MSMTTPWFIRARLKTRQLMLLTAICDEGNIHRAAEVLNMSQPAASKLLKDLEDMLGVSLFERQPRGMRPNWYGETMIRHARIALSSLREAGQEVDALKAGLSGHVSLGAITGPALSLIPQAIHFPSAPVWGWASRRSSPARFASGSTSAHFQSQVWVVGRGTVGISCLAIFHSGFRSRAASAPQNSS